MDNVYARTHDSKRHNHIVELEYRQISQRLFRKWFMGFREAPVSVLQKLSQQQWSHERPWVEDHSAESPGMHELLKFLDQDNGEKRRLDAGSAHGFFVFICRCAIARCMRPSDWSKRTSSSVADLAIEKVFRQRRDLVGMRFQRKVPRIQQMYLGIRMTRQYIGACRQKSDAAD